MLKIPNALRKLAHAIYKMKSFQGTNFDIFLIFAQNILYCGYRLEPALCFGAKISKIGIPPAYPGFSI